MAKRVKVAILGASGYGAGELMRLLYAHPAVEIVACVSTLHPNERLDVIHPHLAGFYDQKTKDRLDLSALAEGDEAVVISALPHGVSGAALRGLIETGPPATLADRLRVIDLSGDFRLRHEQSHAAHYPGAPWAAELRKHFIYGLPEIARSLIREARWIANPGCMATACILAAAPLAERLDSASWVFDVKTGSSGSGRELKPATHHPTRHANFVAYKPLTHPHEAEVSQALGDPGGERFEMGFVAQSMDVARGIFATVHVVLPEELPRETLEGTYRRYYEWSMFVRMREESPQLQDVVASNFCDIAVASRGRRIVVMAALDNLVKGMAGTAIQNLNLMCGLEETTGLWVPSPRPI